VEEEQKCQKMGKNAKNQIDANASKPKKAKPHETLKLPQ
jgi:hypothetical protein